MGLSFVVPIYNENETIAALVDSIREHCGGQRVQIILVNDGSTDRSRATVDSLADRFEEVEAVHFEANRGKTEALATGFSQAHGEIVFTIDADLQDDPIEIPRFLAKLDEGYDLVSGWKSVRRDPLGKRLPSRIFNAFVGRLFGLPMHDINCGFKAMRLEVARSLKLRHDYHRLIPVIASREGFTVGEIEVQHHPRRHGSSKYGIERYWKGLRDVARLWWELRKRK